MRILLPLYRVMLLAGLLFSTGLAGQTGATDSVIDISRIQLFTPIANYTSSAYIPAQKPLQEVYPSLNLRPGFQHNRNIPNEFVTRKLVLRFRVCNNADTVVRMYFTPGFYYSAIHLYRAEGTTLEALPVQRPDIPDGDGYRLLSLPPKDTLTVVAELVFVKTYINTTRPRLIHPAYLTSFIAELRSNRNEDTLVTYVFCGLLLMMVLFSLASWSQGANFEFVYYSGYAFFIGAMLMTKAMFNLRTTSLNYFLESYLDFILQSVAIMFYMIFMQRFLATRLNHPFLHRLYNTGIFLLVASTVLFSGAHFFTHNYPLEYGIELVTKIFLLLMIVIFLVYSLRRWQDVLLRYLFWGNLFLFIFSLLSQVFSLAKPHFRGVPEIFNSALFYYEVGLFLELVLFLMGLNYKNRKQIIEQTREREALKAENKMKEYEKELAVFKAQQAERDRISADMHDELGSGMTAIRLMSEIARNKMKEQTPVEIDKISSSADDVLNKMNAIIWSMHSGNDSLDNLVSYIRSYAHEYFENTAVVCRVHTPAVIPEKEITGDKRRNLFLVVKETLNNVLKHANATSLMIDIEVNGSLVITIRDNGRGIDLNQVRQFGNGLKNMRRRMEGIGGSFDIRNENGTVTRLVLGL